MVEKSVDIETRDGTADCILMHPDSGGPYPAAGVTYETDHYSARHGYAVKDNPAYDAEAEARHWKRLFEVLAKVFPRH